MQRTKQLLGAVSAIALIAISSSPAIAAGTTAGDTITNNVSVGYKVGGVDQTAVTDSDTFTVDRKVNVTVTEVGSSSTVVVPGQTQAAIKFTVQNNSNDVVDFALSVDQSASDDFDISSVQYYVDTNADGIFNAGDTLVTYLDEVAEDATVTVFVVGDVPVSVTNSQTADVALIANAHLGGTASSQGAELTNSGANTVSGVETVLADLAGDADSANEGDHSDTDTFIVESAELTVAKSSSIISDPVNGATNPKAIPGAIVQYCVAVSNAGTGSASATDVNVNDVLPADVSYYAAFGIFVDGDGSCASGSAGGSYDAGDHEVDGTLSDIPAGSTKSLYFQVTID